MTIGMKSKGVRCEERSKKIKTLVESTAERVKERLEQAKIKQRQIQDKRENITSVELLIGQAVTIKSLKIQGKLEPKYHGIFTIDSITTHGNVWLKTKEGLMLKQSVPRSRIKLVPTDLIEERTVSVEVEQILKHRMKKGQIEYFVKWKDQDDSENTWTPENNFDTTECIEEYWNEITQPAEPINHIKAVGQPRSTKTISKSLPKLLVTIVILTWLTRMTDSFKVKDNFKLCEIHENVAVWDASNSCNHRLQTNHQKGKLYYILEKDDMAVQGSGWKCTRTVTHISTYMDFIGTVTHEEDNPKLVELTAEDCWEQIRSNKCDGKRMTCIGNLCKSTNKPNTKDLDHYYLQTTKTTYTTCETVEQHIYGESLDTRIHLNTEPLPLHCKALDGCCELQTSTIVWHKKVIQECSFSRVEAMWLYNRNNLFYSNKENKVFQMTENTTICKDIGVLKTAEGLYLTTDVRAKNMRSEPQNVRMIDDLMLTEIDYSEFKTTSLMLNMLQLVNEKICQLSMATINIYSKLDEEFFVFTDFNGNEATLYSDKGTIFIPQCTQIYDIEVIEETTFCYKDFPVQIIHNNRTTNAFLTKEKVIKLTSKQVTCTNHKDTLYLRSTNRILTKDQNKIKIEPDNKYMHIQFNLQQHNITEINFVHDKHILNSVDLISQLANLTAVEEKQGAFHITTDQYSESETKFKNVITTTYATTRNMIWEFIWKGGLSTITTILVISMLIWIICPMIRQCLLQARIPSKIQSSPITDLEARIERSITPNQYRTETNHNNQNNLRAQYLEEAQMPNPPKNSSNFDSRIPRSINATPAYMPGQQRI